MATEITEIFKAVASPLQWICLRSMQLPAHDSGLLSNMLKLSSFDRCCLAIQVLSSVVHFLEMSMSTRILCQGQFPKSTCSSCMLKGSSAKFPRVLKLHIMIVMPGADSTKRFPEAAECVPTGTPFPSLVHCETTTRTSSVLEMPFSHYHWLLS